MLANAAQSLSSSKRYPDVRGLSDQNKLSEQSSSTSFSKKILACGKAGRGRTKKGKDPKISQKDLENYSLGGKGPGFEPKGFGGNSFWLKGISF